MQIEGSKTGRELPGIVDEVITMAIMSDENGAPYRAFVCQTLNQWGYPAKDRSGRMKNIPLMSIAIAVINNKFRKIDNIIQLTEIAFEIKRYLKTTSKSSYLIDRRRQNQGKYSRKEEIKLIQEQLKIHQAQNSKYFKP